MRNIIVITLLLISASHHSLHANEELNSYVIVGAGIIAVGIVDSVYKLVQQEKRKNELLAELVKKQSFSPEKCDQILKALQETARMHVQVTGTLVEQFKDHPDQKHKLDGVVDKAVDVHQEISNVLDSIVKKLQQQFSAA
jgi:hypothetical protein